MCLLDVLDFTSGIYLIDLEINGKDKETSIFFEF